MCAAVVSVKASGGNGQNWAAEGSINNMRGGESDVVNSEFKNDAPYSVKTNLMWVNILATCNKCVRGVSTTI